MAHHGLLVNGQGQIVRQDRASGRLAARRRIAAVMFVDAGGQVRQVHD